MFHAINSALARLARRFRDRKLAHDHVIAKANGWQVQRVAASTYRYRDSRFDQHHSECCPSYNGTGQQWYQGRGNGDRAQAACSTCGNGRVGSKGTGKWQTSAPMGDG